MEGQNVDGYIYFKSFVNPPDCIAKARAYEWKDNEVLGCSYPKAGTHFLLLTTLLIAFKGDLPEKTCIHSLSMSAEFVPGKRGNNGISMDTPEQCPTNPRICLSHMPMHHVNYNESSCFLYVMRDPVSSLASLRRMEYLMFGPILSPSLEEFFKYHLHTRATGMYMCKCMYKCIFVSARVCVCMYACFQRFLSPIITNVLSIPCYRNL